MNFVSNLLIVFEICILCFYNDYLPTLQKFSRAWYSYFIYYSYLFLIYLSTLIRLNLIDRDSSCDFIASVALSYWYPLPELYLKGFASILKS